MQSSEDKAKQQFLMLNLVRFVGLAFVILGVTMISGKILGPDGAFPGTILVIMGAIEFFIAPVILKKMWRTPEE